jgi:HEAT repeat protein
MRTVSRLLVALLLSAAPARAGDGPDSPMDADPAVPMPRQVNVFPAGSLELWLAALGRPEQDFQAQAAMTIASAHERGMPGLAAAVGPLVRVLDQPGQSSAVRLAAARALVALDAKEAAGSLFLWHRSEGADYREIVEPALARWGYEPARAVWLDRLTRPPPYTRATVLAMRGLAAARDERAVPALRDIALSSVAPAAYRVEAARALGTTRMAGGEADAARLAGGGVTDRLAAAWLLRQHPGDGAVRLLVRLATDAEPAVGAVAVVRLVELGPELVLPVLGPVLASPEQAVRAAGVEVLFRLPAPDHLRLLGDRLNDPHPDVRAKARRSLRDLTAKPDLRGPVIEQGVRVLAGRDWRGQEQAAILLARLDHKPAAGRLVELLGSDRGEAFAAAAFGLRVLAVPDTLPAALDHVRRRHQALLKSGPSAGLQDVPAVHLDRELCQLAQFFGQAGYRPADDALRGLVPRFVGGGRPPKPSPVGTEARAAAIWALGKLHPGDPEEELAGQIEERLTGDPGLGQDHPRVRRMAAVALGRMKATAALEPLRGIADGDAPNPDPVANACRWAVAHIEGKELPPPGTFEVVQRDPFLVPLK